MKKLVTMLAVVGFVPYAHAAEGADFSHSGEFRMQYQKSANTDFKEGGAGSRQHIGQRLRWGTNVRAGEKLSSHFTLVHNGRWGENPTQVPDTIDTTNASGQNLLLVNEAYMTWMATDAMMIRAGRGSFTMADGSVVSANDYEAVATAFDGVLASYDHEMARLSLFGVKGGISETKGSVTEDNLIARFYGVSADFKTLPNFLKTLSVHYMAVKQDEADYLGAGGPVFPTEDATRMGVALGGELAGLDYKFDYAMWTGKRTTTNGGTANSDISASMMDLQVGYGIRSLMKSHFHFAYHSDSGTKTGSTKDETYQGFFYERHENAGLMDILAWGNLTYMKVGATFVPLDDITVGADYYMFSKTEKTDYTYGDTGKLVIGAGGALVDSGSNRVVAGGAEAEIGSELDVVVTKKYTNNFNISARYGMFTPGKAFSPAMRDAETQMYLESKLTF